MFSFLNKEKAEYAAKKMRELLGDAATVTVNTENGSEKHIVCVTFLKNSFNVEYKGVKVKFSRS